MHFVNEAEFHDPSSFKVASGVNLSPNGAVTDGKGNVLFRLKTGGIMSPRRHELPAGTILHRFASAKGGGLKAMQGGWWVERESFQRILRFAKVNNLTDPMAARILCGVPPEWSDMGIMVKVAVRHPLLAWRGLANSVIIPHSDGGPQVKMLHQNANAARRLPQLFIPGLRPGPEGAAMAKEAFIFDGEWNFSAEEANRGWIYL